MIPYENYDIEIITEKDLKSYRPWARRQKYWTRIYELGEKILDSTERKKK